MPKKCEAGNMSKLIVLALVLSCSGAMAATSSGCIKTTGNLAQDKIIARAVAKGNLSHELGATVSASTRFESTTNEKGDSLDVSDSITETVTVSSEHFINAVVVVGEGYEQVADQKHYCVYLTRG